VRRRGTGRRDDLHRVRRAVIGGISLDGGKGTLFGAMCGVLVLGLINNVLTLAGVSRRWIQAICGGIILARPHRRPDHERNGAVLTRWSTREES
jgi:ribose/xylose/arabinose/galactoside ABC-type transport system permease subunit